MAAGDPLWPTVPRRELTLARAAVLTGDKPAQRIDYEFSRPELLAEALTHRSAPRPPGAGGRRSRRAVPRNYERLEFLGDRVLGLVIADLLWRRFDSEAEGPLTQRHAQLVRRETLAAIGDEIGLVGHLVLSPAEAAAGAARNPAILADAVEAVVAAIYLDGGFAAAFRFVERLWAPRIAAMDRPPRDPKTTLQEWTQGRGLPLPAYELTATSGPDHARHFTVSVTVAGHDGASATATSKRAAEAGAAAALIERLTGGVGT
jgi:ribonuclease III